MIGQVPTPGNQSPGLGLVSTQVYVGPARHGGQEQLEAGAGTYAASGRPLGRRNALSRVP